MATRKPKVEAAPEAAPKVKKTTTRQTKSAKELATERDEPYVAIIGIELDPENVGNGAFELDWNDKFITQLVRAGYQSKPNEAEDVIIDRWFRSEEHTSELQSH